MRNLPKITPQRLAVRLTPKAEVLVKKGHPWIFTDSIEKISKEGKTGDLVILFDKRRDKPFAIGLYDPESPIVIKVLSHVPAQINSRFFEEKVKAAYAIRKPLLRTDTNSYRLIFGENDHFPSFIGDVYDDVLVVKLYAGIWWPYLKDVLPHLIAISNAETVVLRLSRSLEKQNSYGLKDGDVIYGSLKKETVIFREHGVRFSANVIHGHKTGYFLDHRANRKRVGELSQGKTVLDVFSYAGGFSVHALVGGATEVTSVDISAKALEVAQANGKLNKHKGKHKIITGDAFEILERLIGKKTSFDVVVIDPPSFAKSAREVHTALYQYERLAKLGIQLVTAGGMLVLASCSSRVGKDQFLNACHLGFQKTKRKAMLVEQTAHDVDHPVTFDEGAYLKCGYFKIQ